jgi:hypothetical protein
MHLRRACSDNANSELLTLLEKHCETNDGAVNQKPAKYAHDRCLLVD